ncbi:unnamed protein product [Moneuplotes crassus]|uniref:DAGKc domain-containing protein n=1 Tax=Euplotes crassus TaxID=5936 RepID=A0AAD1UHT7_EUPCR|nr:unnamed protein product [Moneuplotes crassus]
MGSSNSILVSKDHLEERFFCNVKIDDSHGPDYSLIQLHESILFVNQKEVEMKKKLEDNVKVKDYLAIKHDAIFCLKPADEMPHTLVIGYTDEKKVLKKQLFFNEKSDYDRFLAHYSKVCRSRVPCDSRSIAILVNPISGKGKSIEYFEKYLRPMLEMCGIQYTCRCTSSETYIDEWVSALDLLETPYTDFVMIGGDGILSQFMNAVIKREDHMDIFKIPIGIIPGGSTNATACDLSGKNPIMACVNIVRGYTIEADMLKCTLKNQKKTMLTATVTWGSFANIVHNAERWRKCFGSCRYNVCGFREIFLKCKFKSYNADVMFKSKKTDEISTQVGENSSLEEKESDQPFVALKNNKFTFFSIVSHECRSSNDESILAPFARYSDKKLNFISVAANNRFELVKVMTKMIKGKHCNQKAVQTKKAMECIIKPSSDSYFNIDGEIYPNDEAHVKILPKFLNLMGKLHERDGYQRTLTEKIENETTREII